MAFFKMLLVGDSNNISSVLYTCDAIKPTAVTKPKVLAVQYIAKLEVPSLLSFFVTRGNYQSLYTAASSILTGLVIGLCYASFSSSSSSDEMSAVSSGIDVGDAMVELHNTNVLTSNSIYHHSTDLTILNKNFSQLPLGVIIKYTKLSRQVRKNLRGKQRYKAYLTLPQDIKIRGCVFRLYKLYALASSDTRNYESYANLHFVMSELYFNDLNYDMLYLQIQKLMLQSYVDNGSRAVVPSIVSG